MHNSIPQRPLKTACGLVARVIGVVPGVPAPYIVEVKGPRQDWPDYDTHMDETGFDEEGDEVDDGLIIRTRTENYYPNLTYNGMRGHPLDLTTAQVSDHYRSGYYVPESAPTEKRLSHYAI